MSELSESGHLRTKNPEHAVALLKKAKLPGYVFPEANDWVTFVYPPGDENRFDLSQANERLLLLYELAAEHGCWVTIYQGKKPVTRLRAEYQRPNALFDKQAFASLELLSEGGVAAVDAWVKRAHVALERGRAPYCVAERLHLPRYAWLSYLGEQTKQTPDPRRIEVLANGTVKRPPRPTAPHVAPPTPPPKKGRANKATAKKASLKKTASTKSASTKPAPKKKTATAKPKPTAKKKRAR